MCALEDHQATMHRSTRRGAGALAALLVAGCAATAPDRAPVADPSPIVARFSDSLPGGALPKGWQPWTFSGLKRETAYELIDADGRTVVRAQADRSASGLVYKVRFDPRAFPILSWRWKVGAPIKTADNTHRTTDDSPARIVVAFDGDTKKLAPMERLAFKKFRMLTQQELPYATLMYIWENAQPRDTVIPNMLTSRIKMIVAESGAEGRVGEWREETRNVYEDYKRAFGEEPPPVMWIGLLSDTDNTGESARAYYGDVRVSPRR
jgi:hypothetical protein